MQNYKIIIRRWRSGTDASGMETFRQANDFAHAYEKAEELVRGCRLVDIYSKYEVVSILNTHLPRDVFSESFDPFNPDADDDVKENEET